MCVKLYCVALVDNGWTNVGLNLVADTFNSLSRVRWPEFSFLPRARRARGFSVSCRGGTKLQGAQHQQPKKAPNKDDPAKSHSAFAAFRTMVNVQFIFIFKYTVIHGAPGESGARGRGPHETRPFMKKCKTNSVLIDSFTKCFV